MSQKSETVAEFGDSRTFMRQCGQGLKQPKQGEELSCLVFDFFLFRFQRKQLLGPTNRLAGCREEPTACRGNRT